MDVHVQLLVERGIHIIECLNVESLSQSGVKSSQFVASPLKIRGGTGSPIRPVAVKREPGLDVTINVAQYFFAHPRGPMVS